MSMFSALSCCCVPYFYRTISHTILVDKVNNTTRYTDSVCHQSFEIILWRSQLIEVELCVVCHMCFMVTWETNRKVTLVVDYVVLKQQCVLVLPWFSEKFVFLLVINRSSIFFFVGGFVHVSWICTVLVYSTASLQRHTTPCSWPWF